MPYGYMGKILWISLNDLKVNTLDTMDYTGYIGGRGIATRLFWEKAKPRIKDGLDPDNLLILMTGPLSGTLSPSSGRTTTCFKSVVQWPKPWFSYSNFGGEWGPQLKFAGYDGIVLHGRADHPVYIWVNDDRVEYRDARAIWGQDTCNTQQMIIKELGGDKRIKVVTIGPAGENLVRQAILITDTGDAAGWGAGAVMGSKNVKAIAVRGTKGVKVADPKTLFSENNHFFNISAEQRKEMIGPTYGIKGTALEHSFKRNGNCFACSQVCHSFLTPKNGPSGENWCAPIIDSSAWEGQAKRGLSPLTTPFGDTSYAGPPAYSDNSWFFGKSLDLMGINAFNFGGLGHVASSWAVTCYELGIFTKKVTSPIDLSIIGTREFSEIFASAVAHRKGKFATLLGEGAVRAAAYIREHPEEIGLTKKQAEKQWEICERNYPAHGMLNHFFYQGFDFIHIRQAPLNALFWALSTRDPISSLHAISMVYDGGFQPHGNSRGHAKAAYLNEDAGCSYLDAEDRPVLSNQTGQPERGKYYDYQNIERKPVRANYTKGTPQALKYAFGYAIQNDSLTLCDFVFPLIGGRGNYSKIPADPEKCTDVSLGARLYTAVTGIPRSFEQLMEDSWRVWLVERAIHVRDDDRTRNDDTLSSYYYDRPDDEGIAVDREYFEKGKSEFYKLMGCDVNTGNPTRLTLEKYGLKDIADQLTQS
jgi:aldehyde:ferredoxin oxidoreductase